MKKRALHAMIDRLEGENTILRQALEQRVKISNRNYEAGMDLACHVALGTDITNLSALTVLEQLRGRCAEPDPAYHVTGNGKESA